MQACMDGYEVVSPYKNGQVKKKMLTKTYLAPLTLFYW